jgi:hypothetical protein
MIYSRPSAFPSEIHAHSRHRVVTEAAYHLDGHLSPLGSAADLSAELRRKHVVFARASCFRGGLARHSVPLAFRESIVPGAMSEISSAAH